MSDTKTFAGLTIDGTVDRGRKNRRVEQRPKEDLEPLLSALLAIEGVEAIRWRQYTPYFNDGEPCVFRISDVYVKVAGTDEEAGDYEDGFVSAYDVELQGGQPEQYNYETRSFVAVGDPLPRHPAYDAFKAFDAAIDSGAFEHALEDLFGDHVVVTVTRDGITVDEYVHD